MHPHLRTSLLLLLAPLVALAGAPTHAQLAYMVDDLGDTSHFGYSGFYGPVSEHLTVGSKVYFFEDDGGHGRPAVGGAQGEAVEELGAARGLGRVRQLRPVGERVEQR